MEVKVNGIIHPHASGSSLPSTNGHGSTHIENEALIKGLEGEPSLEELEHELPIVHDGQVPLGELLSRVVQAIYAELTEMSET